MELLRGARKRRTAYDDFARPKRLCLLTAETLPVGVKLTSPGAVDLRSLHRFHSLVDGDNNIADCLRKDHCRRFSDAYLLAQTYIYFVRCRLKPDEFTPRNFYYLLYLANDMEEDLDFKHELLPWCLGPSWRSKMVDFQRGKQGLWARLNFRLLVKKEDLDAIITAGNHWVWSRRRNEYHAGAMRDCKRPKYEVAISPAGPTRPPMGCEGPCNRSPPPVRFDWSDCSDDSPGTNLLSDSDSDSAYYSNNTSLV